MRAARALAALALGLLLVGCETTPWIRGRISEGLPQHVEKFAPDISFHVGKTERRVGKAFATALRARGFELAEREEDADVLVKITLNSWEFNDAGFSGFRARDDMDMTVACVDRRTHRVLARANIEVRSDFRIIAKYVDSL